MFKKLRNRFLLMHMGMVSLLVVLFFGSILFLTYSSMEAGTDRRLDGFVRMRSQGFSADGVPPELRDGHRAESWNDVNDDTPNRLPNEAAEDIHNDEPLRDSPSEPAIGIQLRTDRMTPGIFITMNENHQVTEVDDVFEMGDDFYSRAAAEVVSMESEFQKENRERSAGKIRLDNIELKYQMDGNKIALINITQESVLFYNMLRLFLFIALPLLLVIFLISMFFARSAIKPIETSYNRQKEFIADASHELKTPLAAISANLDVLNGTATDEQRQWVGYIQSEVGRMSGLTSSLLYLTKMDFASKGENGIEINVGKLVEDHLLPLEAVLFEKGISLAADIQPSVLIRGDYEQMKRLVGILIDNAFRYAAASIDVNVARVQNQAVLTVANDGPGIAPEEIEKIWERFYRSDKARLYDGGYGLGLPMAKAIVDRRGGKISCESLPGIRTVFTVKLPNSSQK